METIKDYLEILYFLSGPAILVVAIIGLKQITISKENRKITSKRESFRLAAEQCKFYIETIIPLQNTLNSKIDTEKIEFFKKSKVVLSEGEIEIKPYMDNGAFDKVFDCCLEEIMLVVNYMESFALFFVSGIASELVGFNTVGKTYVYTVKKLLPFIVPMSKDGTYKNIILLFNIWNTRFEKNNLLNEKAEIERKLKINKSISIESIGTK